MQQDSPMIEAPQIYKYPKKSFPKTKKNTSLVSPLAWPKNAAFHVLGVSGRPSLQLPKPATLVRDQMKRSKLLSDIHLSPPPKKRSAQLPEIPNLHVDCLFEKKIKSLDRIRMCKTVEKTGITPQGLTVPPPENRPGPTKERLVFEPSVFQGGALKLHRCNQRSY